MPLFEGRKILAGEQKPDRSPLAGRSLNKTVCFERADHLVYGRRAYLKVSLHVGLGWRLAVDLAVIVNER
jgi:hypothetical protein